MKIGFFGNAGNYPFILAQAVRKMGHEVVFVVERKELLYRPESRDFEFAAGYPTWIKDGSCFSELDYMSLSPKIGPILDLLSGCDALILNSLGPSLLPLLRRPAIAFLTGSDLSYYGNPEMVEARTATWDNSFRVSAEGQEILCMLQDVVKRQREGIRASAMVYHFPKGILPAHDALLADIGVSESRRLFFYMAELDRVRPTTTNWRKRCA